MRPDKEGLILTERDEFVVIGQAFSESKSELPELDALDASTEKLSLKTKSDDKQEWFIPCGSFKEYQIALSGVRKTYETLLAKEDRGSYCENASRNYYHITNLGRVATNLTEGIYRALGIPRRVEPRNYDD